MKIFILDSADQAETCTAKQIIQTVLAKPKSVLGLATGGTMPPVYRRLVLAHRREEASFAQVTTFNLDEYVGLDPSHPCSYHYFMKQELLGPAGFNPERTHLPFGNTKNAIVEADRYEALIHKHGPIDLQLLGIGSNGHIGFNEPTSSFGSRTRIKTLTKTTRIANQRYFSGSEEAPRYAITVGIKTILESRRIVLLATGNTKAAAVAGMIEGPVSAFCPASALQFHPATTIILDRAAASDLKMHSYYHEVHPGGEDVHHAN